MPDPNFDYEAALTACARGNQAALRNLYNQEAARMLALAGRMLADQTDAANIVHDAFVLIWKNAGSYDPDAAPARAWIYSIMRYRILNRLRQTGRPVPGRHAAAWSADLPAGESHSITVNTLRALDEQQRLPILMAYYGGLDYPRIATMRHAPQEQIRARVRAALGALIEADAR